MMFDAVGRRIFMLMAVSIVITAIALGYIVLSMLLGF